MSVVWNGFIAGLNDLAAVLGTLGTITLVAVVFGSVLFILYLILLFGDRAVQMFLPFLSEAVKILRSESTKTHPAIRLEMRFQQFLGVIVIFTLLANLLHALIPFVRERSEQVLQGALITSGILFVVLGCVSLN